MCRLLSRIVGLPCFDLMLVSSSNKHKVLRKMRFEICVCRFCWQTLVTAQLVSWGREPLNTVCLLGHVIAALTVASIAVGSVSLCTSLIRDVVLAWLSSVAICWGTQKISTLPQGIPCRVQRTFGRRQHSRQNLHARACQ